MKFGDIKQGDTVYIFTTTSMGWRGGKSFWLPKQVDKVTPKQFTVDDQRYRKDDGSPIGGRGGADASKLGDRGFNGPVTDQTTERDALVRNLNVVSEISGVIDQFRPFRIDHQHPKLSEIHALLKEVERLLVEA